MNKTNIKFNKHSLSLILEGRKTQTRRPVKPQPPKEFYQLLGSTSTGFVFSNMSRANPCEPNCLFEVECPYSVGQDLIVLDELGVNSKIKIKVEDVSVESLNYISASDCFDEGMNPSGYDPCDIAEDAKDRFRDFWDTIYKESEYEWSNNPFVFVIRFTVI